MELQKEFLVNLKNYFRLNIYEVKIWASLLSRGVASASELAEISGVPRSRCYDVLESLEKKGFIMVKIGKPIEYTTIKPEVIIERLNKELRTNSEKVIQYMDEIGESDDFKELDMLYKSGVSHIDISSISRSIVGASSVNKQIKDMIGSAKSNICFVTSTAGLQRKSKIIKNILPDLKKRGVEVKVYSPYDKSIMKKLDGVKFIDYNAHTQFVSADNSQIIFMVTPDSITPEYEIGIWIKSDLFVAAVNMLFQQSVK